MTLVGMTGLTYGDDRGRNVHVMHSSLPLPPLEALEAMLAAARTGSFSAAAVELELTHGSVSRRVHALESWLGTPIFTRHGRGVRLTPAGEQFAREVESALAQISAIAVDLRAARATPSRLRISVLPSLARLWLVPRLAALQLAAPGILLQVQVEHRLAVLDGNDADIAIRYGMGEWPGMESRLLLKERLFAIGAPAVADRLLGRSAAAVMGETLLHDQQQHWRSWCERAGIAFRPRKGELRFDDHDLVLAAAEAGLGVAIARWPLAAPALDAQKLVRIDGPEFADDKAHHIVMRSGERRRAVLRLADALSALAAEKPSPGKRR